MEYKIRGWRLNDAADLARAVSNKNVQDNLRDGIPYPYGEVDAREYIRKMLNANDNEVFAFAITLDDIAVGSIAVFRGTNVHRCTGELGYYVAEEHWNNGAVTAAIRQITEYIFHNTDIIRIFAEPFAYNAASCRVLEKAGFVYEGTLRANAVKNGEVLDMKMYALVKE